MGGKLIIWTLSDTRIGIQNQVVGLAEAIARMIPATIQQIHVPRPNVLTPFLPAKPTTPMKPPWPDIVIGCGQASLPYSAAFRKWSGGKTLVVQLQNPRHGLKRFDLIIAPEHDRLEGENVFSIIGSTHRICGQKLNDAKTQFADQLDTLPKPRIAVLIGGKSKRHQLTKPLLKTLCDQLDALAEANISLMISTSRRTPGFARRRLRRKFKSRSNVWFWSGAKSDGPNPYFAYLASADAIIVTSDSTNMLCEAATTSAPVLLFRLEGSDGKFADLYAALEKQDQLRPFTGALTSWDVPPFDETRRAAEEVLRRLHDHLKASSTHS